MVQNIGVLDCIDPVEFSFFPESVKDVFIALTHFLTRHQFMWESRVEPSIGQSVQALETLGEELLLISALLELTQLGDKVNLFLDHQLKRATIVPSVFPEVLDDDSVLFGDEQPDLQVLEHEERGERADGRFHAVLGQGTYFARLRAGPDTGLGSGSTALLLAAD